MTDLRPRRPQRGRKRFRSLGGRNFFAKWRASAWKHVAGQGLTKWARAKNSSNVDCRLLKGNSRQRVNLLEEYDHANSGSALLAAPCIHVGCFPRVSTIAIARLPAIIGVRRRYLADERQPASTPPFWWCGSALWLRGLQSRDSAAQFRLRLPQRLDNSRASAASNSCLPWRWDDLVLFYGRSFRRCPWSTSHPIRVDVRVQAGFRRARCAPRLL